MSQITPNLGKVYLVGAGPGDPGLITVRGGDCLRQADVVLYDYLVNPAVLRHAPAAAEVVCLGHHGVERLMPQEEVQRRMIRAALEGRTVVRLKGGDPMVFGRGAEEIDALRAAGVPYEIVPGITAAVAAAGYAEIPITEAEHSSAVALVTGQERRHKDAASLDYGALADFPGTLIFYMGVTSARQWSDALLGRGKPAHTPATIVRRCSWSDQTTTGCTLGTVADEIAARRLRPPAVIVVGDVGRLAPHVSWFCARPLVGTRVLVTRPRDQAHDLCQRLLDLGADVLIQPAITISDPADWQPVDDALNHLDRYDWIVFSSANGVRPFLDRLGQMADLRRLGRVHMAAIGPGTAEELARYRLRADRIPDQYRAESLAESLAHDASGRRFLLVRASRGREVLAQQLTAAGAHVEQVVVYTNADVTEADPQIAAALAARQIDWITVTSSTIARSLVRLFGQRLRSARLASISPITSDVLRGLGYAPATEAAEYTMTGVVKAILEQEQKTP